MVLSSPMNKIPPLERKKSFQLMNGVITINIPLSIGCFFRVPGVNIILKDSEKASEEKSLLYQTKMDDGLSANDKISKKEKTFCFKNSHIFYCLTVVALARGGSRRLV